MSATHPAADSDAPRSGAPAFGRVILDLEGTLVTGRSPQVAVWREALAACRGAEPGWTWPQELADGNSPWTRVATLGDARSIVEQRAGAAGAREFVQRVERGMAGLAQARGLWLLPGVEACLAELSGRGYRFSLATYAGRGVVELALGELGLGEWIEEVRCLDGAGPDDKGAMLTELCELAGTRSALMVGDSDSDWDASERAGLPFLRLSPEEPRAGDEVGRWPLLPGRIEGRLERLDRLLDRAQLRGRPTIEVAGAPLAGARILAEDLADRAGVRGGAGPHVIHRNQPWDDPSPSDRAARLLVVVDRPTSAARRMGGAHFGAESGPAWEARWEQWEADWSAGKPADWAELTVSGEDPLNPAKPPGDRC